MSFFAPPSLFPYSFFTDDSGYPIHSFFVDYRSLEDRFPIATLIKRCEREFAFEHCGTICISKPEKYRDFGEVLIKDQLEGRPTRILEESEVTDAPDDLRKTQARNEEFNRMAKIAGFGIRRIKGSVTTRTQKNESLSFDKFGWIYCASIAPAGQDEEDVWKNSFRENNYNHSSYIRRPLEFSHALGAMVVEQLGPQISSVESRFSVAGQSKTKLELKGQVLFHGPVIYVDDPYEVVSNATREDDRLYLPFLVKSAEYRYQREYRFVILTENEPAETDTILSVSPAMKGVTRNHPRPNFTYPELQNEATQPLNSGEPDEPTTTYSSVDHEVQTDLPIVENIARQLSDSVFAPETPISARSPADSTVTQTYVLEAISTISSLKALRNRVSNLFTGAPRIEVAAAAYHAEPCLLDLCEEFEDPIDSIAIQDQDFIVVNINFSPVQEVTAKLVFGPSGDFCLSIRKSHEHTFSVRHNGWLTGGQDITKTLAEAGLTRRSPTQ